MLSKIFRSSGSGFAALILSMASLLSYVVGLLRDRVMAVYFGQSSMVDAYNTAFLIPDFIFNLFIAGALTGVFIPIFSEYLYKDKKQAYALCDVFLTVMNGITIVAGGLMFVLAPWVIPAVFSTAEPEIQQHIIGLTRIMLLSPILMGLSNTLGSMLISYKHYVSYSLSAPLYNVGIIIGILLFQEQAGIYAAAYGVIIGLVLHLCVRFFDIVQVGYEYRPRVDLKHPGFRKMVRLMIPKTVGLLAWQGNLWAYNIIGYTLAGGSIAAFNYARNIQSFSVSLFGIALATAVFPFLAEFASKKESGKFAKRLEKTTSQILYLTIPATVGLMMLSTLVIQVILKGGAFDADAVAITSSVLFVFCLSIPLESLMHLFSRAFYSYQNTLIPVGINLLFMVLNISLTYWLAQSMGVQAFAISFVIASVLQTGLLILIFRVKFLAFNVLEILKNLGKFLIGTLLMAVTLEGVFTLFAGANTAITLIVAVTLGALVYFAVTYLLKCEEMSILDKLWKKVLGR